MTNVLPEHLWGFCANIGDPREYLRQPMCHNDAAILTNGAILLRVQPIAPGLLANMPIFPHIDFPQKIDDAATRLGDHLAPLPSLPPPIQCDFCHGSGFQKSCPECGESGCAHCGGSGMCTTSGDDRDAEACWYCDGTGHCRQSIDIGPTTLDSRLLALIARLDGALIAPDGADNAAYFRSAIGDGLLMPLRKGYA